MKPMVGKIDVTKIKKERLFRGKKGTYLDLVFIPTPTSDYGDYMIKQSVSKEEREAGVEMPILGNVKTLDKGNPGAAPTSKAAGEDSGSGEDGMPF